MCERPNPAACACVCAVYTVVFPDPPPVIAPVARGGGSLTHIYRLKSEYIRLKSAVDETHAETPHLATLQLPRSLDGEIEDSADS